MVAIRISIREQLGCLVFLATSISLTVIALAIWYTNHRFVLDVRSEALMLTASLKSAQLSSNLLLMQILVKQASMRLSPQVALELYYREGRSTDEQWNSTAEDYDAIFAGDDNSRIAVQARIYHKEGSNRILFNRTASSVTNVTLPYERAGGQPALMGDYLYGYIPELYPQFKVRAINREFDQYDAEYQGRVINRTNYLLSGPYMVDDQLALISITMPIFNTNTSDSRTIGWLTVVLDTQLIKEVIDAREGLGHSGLNLLVGPYNLTNNFPDGYLFDTANVNPPQDVQVNYQFPPANVTDARRHFQYGIARIPPPFEWSQFPAIREGFTSATHNKNNAGSVISTRNEDNHGVSIGYAIVNSSMVDWMVVVERSHAEIWAPISRLRRIILTCVFGTMVAMLLFTLPVAHYFSKPITRLRDATSGIVLSEDHLSDPTYANNDASSKLLASKKGFCDRIMHYRNIYAVHRAQKRGDVEGRQFRVPAKVKDHKHLVHDELTDLTTRFNEMTDELTIQYGKLEERVQQRTAELELSKEAAETANEIKTLFIANISHELKTPLNGIMGMCAVCMSEDDPIKLKQSIKLIYKSGDLLLKLLTDLLTFSKSQTGQPSLDEREFRLRDISSQILVIFGQQAEERRIDLSVKLESFHDADLDDDQLIEGSNTRSFGLGRLEDMLLCGDEHRIVQVILNLVSNSLKFTATGGSVTVIIRCAGEIYKSGCRKASIQSRHNSLPNPRSNIIVSANTKESSPKRSQSDTPTVIKPTSARDANSHHVAHHRAVPPPSVRWFLFEFEVQDTGPGIPEHLHSKIFEPFVQGDLSLNKKYGGTGLGLSICSQLAGLMGGTMRMRSEVGRGSVFVMSIPLKHVASRAGSTTSSSVDLASMTPPSQSRPVDTTWIARSTRSTHVTQPVQAHSGATLGVESPTNSATTYSEPAFSPTASLEQSRSQGVPGKQLEAAAMKHRGIMKVLVAEDNRTNQEVMRRMLKLERVHDVTIATDGQEALNKVRESMQHHDPYDLVFMDVQMPNLDGLQATRLIRQSGFRAPIVALTAYTEEANVQKCLGAGMNFFLSKPIRRSAIKHVLKIYHPSISREQEELNVPAPS